MPAESLITVRCEVPVTVHRLEPSRLSDTLLADAAALMAPVSVDPSLRSSAAVLMASTSTEPERV
jgi:hypothetical protein